jgi:hypothetical protein
MKCAWLALCLAFLVLFSGCTTSYAPKKGIFSDGYREEKIDRNTFTVEFKGGSFVSRDRVQTYLLYRCAETTLLNKFDYFAIKDNRVEKTGIRLLTGVGARVTIKTYFGEKPQVVPVTYNAREVVDLLAFMVKE